MDELAAERERILAERGRQLVGDPAPVSERELELGLGRWLPVDFGRELLDDEEAAP